MARLQHTGLDSDYSKVLGYSFDKKMGNNLLLIRNAVLNQNWDGCILVDGVEGIGKSVIAGQIAHFFDIDRTIMLDQVCFTPKDFMEKVLSSSKGKAIIYDEARGGLNRRRSMQEVNLLITDLLSRARRRNLFFIIVMPSIYDMDMNVAVWRSRALIHVRYNWDLENPEKPLQRGMFRFYTEAGKKYLYTDTYSRRNYLYPNLMSKDMSFDGRFTNYWVVNESEYDRKKLGAEEEYLKDYTKSEEIGKEKCPACNINNYRYVKSKNQNICKKCGTSWKGRTPLNNNHIEKSPVEVV